MPALRAQYGLDQPFIVQYGLWVQHLLHGDFGLSLEYQRPNAELIRERARPDHGAGAVLLRADLGDRGAGRHLLGDPSSARSVDHVLTVINYVGVATPNFMLALILMWIAFAYFGISITGLFSPEYVDAPWSLAKLVDLLAHIWLPALVLGIAGTARLTPHHARQPARRAEQALRRDGARQGPAEWRLVLRYPGAARLQSAGQHDRLVSAAPVLRAA